MLGLSDKVTIVLAAGKFKDWDSKFDILYHRPKLGSMTRNHLFTFSCKDISDVLLTTKFTFNSTTITTQKLIKMKKGWDIVDRQNFGCEYPTKDYTRSRSYRHKTGSSLYKMAKISACRVSGYNMSKT